MLAVGSGPIRMRRMVPCSACHHMSNGRRLNLNIVLKFAAAAEQVSKSFYLLVIQFATQTDRPHTHTHAQDCRSSSECLFSLIQGGSSKHRKR